MAALLVPIMAVSDQLPARVVKTLFPGVTTIEYAGQSLRFETQVPLRVGLSPVSMTEIRLRFSSTRSTAGGAQGVQGEDNVQAIWVDWNSELYSGPAPPTWAEWDGILNTESGFTEK